VRKREAHRSDESRVKTSWDETGVVYGIPTKIQAHKKRLVNATVQNSCILAPASLTMKGHRSIAPRAFTSEPNVLVEIFKALNTVMLIPQEKTRPVHYKPVMTTLPRLTRLMVKARD
jgi:hypothetical protein